MVSGDSEDYTLISAPTKAGEYFLKFLKYKRVRLAGLTNTAAGKKRLEKLGVERIVMLDADVHEKRTEPDFPIGKVYLFESSLNLCCQYIQLTRAWTSGPIYVITQMLHPRTIYRGLGADHVVYTRSGDVTFLAGQPEDEWKRKETEES